MDLRSLFSLGQTAIRKEHVSNNSTCFVAAFLVLTDFRFAFLPLFGHEVPDFDLRHAPRVDARQGQDRLAHLHHAVLLVTSALADERAVIDLNQIDLQEETSGEKLRFLGVYDVKY